MGSLVTLALSDEVGRLRLPLSFLFNNLIPQRGIAPTSYLIPHTLTPKL